MPVSAVVISLSAEPELQERAIRALQAHPRVTLGEQQKRLLPVVVDTDTMSEGIELVREGLPKLDGVEFVHVVSVDFSDVDDFTEKMPPKRRSRAT
ncbi:MAG: hypothetical protein ACOC9J_01030 [Persicimonas sp.]